MPLTVMPTFCLYFSACVEWHWGGHRHFGDLTKEKLNWEYDLFALSGTYLCCFQSLPSIIKLLISILE